MPVVFEWRRSTYVPPDPPQNGVAPHVPGTEQITSVGETGGNFFNWSKGAKNLDPFNTGANTHDLFEAPVDGDDWNAANFSVHQLVPDAASVEVWIRPYFGGSGWTAITDLRFYMTSRDLTGYGAGAWVNCRVATQYPLGDADLVGGVSDYGTLYPDGLAGPHTLQPGFDSGSGAIIGPPLSVMEQAALGGNSNYFNLTPGEGVTPGIAYGKYAVLQLATGSEPLPGEGGRQTFTLSYKES